MGLDKLNDNELVELAKKSDDRAITILMEKYKSTVAAISRSYFLIGGDSEDLLQEGMIAIYNAINTFNGQASFSSYVYTCVKNRIISVIKKYNNLKNKPLNNYVSISGGTENDGDKTEIIISSGFGPEESYINDETLRELNKKIESALSKYENEILSHYLKGLSYQDISNKIGKNIKSIDNALQRIRQKLLPIING